MPSGQYQVTELIESEREAVRRVTTALAQLQDRKNADVSAVRRWRMQYQNWLRKIEAKRPRQTSLFGQQRLKEYNQVVDRLNSVHTLREQNIGSYQDNLSELIQLTSRLQQMELASDQITSNQSRLQNARIDIETYEANQRQYQQQNAKYEDYLTRYQVWERLHDQWEDNQQVKTSPQSQEDLMAEINSNEWGLRLIESNGSSLSINQSAVNELAENLVEMQHHSQQNWSGMFDAGIWRIIGRPQASNLHSNQSTANLTTILASMIADKLNEWLSQQELKTNDAQEKPKMPEPQEPEPVYPAHKPESINTPIFELVEIGPVQERTVDVRILDELSDYASGKYARTSDNATRINEIARKAGNDCPTIDIVDTNFDNRELIVALDEIEANINQFGSQKHSSRGIQIVNKLTDSVNQLRSANDYQSVKKAGEAFNESTTQLFIWLSSNWWQLGGTPTGNAHAWKRTNARVLKR